MAAAGFGGSQSAAFDPHRWIARPEVEHQGGLCGETGLSRYHHMGLAKGLLQAVLGDARAKALSRAHLQIAALLQSDQLRLASDGCIPAGGRHRRNNR